MANGMVSTNILQRELPQHIHENRRQFCREPRLLREYLTGSMLDSIGGEQGQSFYYQPCYKLGFSPEALWESIKDGKQMNGIFSLWQLEEDWVPREQG